MDELNWNRWTVWTGIGGQFGSESVDSLNWNQWAIWTGITGQFAPEYADSIIFGCLAFSGLIDKHNLISLIVTMWFIKVIIEIFGLPFSIRLAKKLKQKERLDIYDTKTKFNILSLDTCYKTTDNEFMAEKNPL